jgi:Domain of unknown function (DUF4388)
MEGNLQDTPLSSLLELIHLTKQSGQVQITADVPLTLHVFNGEIISGQVLDWQGLEAIQSFLLHLSNGQFRFQPNAISIDVANDFGTPFSLFMTDWARLNDEWARILPLIGSPSRVMEPSQAVGTVPHPFQGGKSIRSLAKTLGVSSFEVAQNTLPWLQQGDVRLTDRFAWHGLRIQHAGASAKKLPNSRTFVDIPACLDGSRNMGEILELGFSVGDVRQYLIQSLQSGEIQVSGSGWLLRDLTWELEYLK